MNFTPKDQQQGAASSACTSLRGEMSCSSESHGAQTEGSGLVHLDWGMSHVVWGGESKGAEPMDERYRACAENMLTSIFPASNPGSPAFASSGGESAQEGSGRQSSLPGNARWVGTGHVLYSDSSSSGYRQNSVSQHQDSQASSTVGVEKSITDASGGGIRQGSAKGHSSGGEEQPAEATEVSLAHTSGRCKACAFVNTPAGCNRGEDCPFCHLPHQKQQMSRMCKAKRERFKALITRQVQDQEGGPAADSVDDGNTARDRTVQQQPSFSKSKRHILQL